MTRAAAPGLRLAVGGLIALYALGYLLWYSATPLGLYPVLDGREQLALAGAIARGELPHEPFYRAPLYPALIAQVIDLGAGARDLPLLVRLLNALLHLLNAALVWRLALRVWRAPRAAALAAMLAGLSPVALFFAADPLDITLATSFMLGACLATVRATEDEQGASTSLALAGALLGAALLTRPQMLLVVGALALCAWQGSPAGRAQRLLAASLPVLALALAMGAINLRVGGSFAVLPWQGAYNLWAANGPEADGRYFVQRERLAMYTEGVNPARVESERLYRAANPGAPDDPASMSRYWQARTLAALRAEPLRWLELEARKAWYLLNDFEQYDLKTYFVHKAQSPWLRWNPLGWGVLLVGAVLALGLRGLPRAGRVVVLFSFAYGASLLLSYVSARFRLPLAPLLAVLAGGVLANGVEAVHWRRALPVAALTATLTFWPLPAAERERTVVQDYLLEARAALMVGDTTIAVQRARQALTRAPRDEAAREVLCVAPFNAWLHGPLAPDPALRTACADAAPFSPVARRALGVLAWRAGDDDLAKDAWRGLSLQAGPERDAAAAALIMSGEAVAPLDDAGLTRSADVLLLARALRGDRRAEARLRARLPEAELARQADNLERLFAR
ncbi:MAG: glycosyltransferase family 39 protein [Gammaproteobacteria bacterium]|nr:glycosyltransferase family 39 protein [Gammaproteobacteria bacterium]